METVRPCGSRCQESWWSAPRGSGTLDIHSSGWSESIDIKDMCTEGGEELVFRELDQRFPGKVAAERRLGRSLWAENHEGRDNGGFHWTVET